VVLAAGGDGSTSSHALENLCRTYWLPLYTYIRRQGYGPHDAQDLTQGFFARLLRGNPVAGVSPDKGKFRTYLLVALNHFLSDERDHARAQKRGGGQVIVSLDAPDPEQRYLQVPHPNSTPEKAFDRGWALTVMEEAMRRLRSDYESPGRKALFETLRPFLASEADPGAYDKIAPRVGMSPGAVAVNVHRLRQRYRECIRLELAETVSSTKDLDEEMTYLFSTILA
jgi:RNA polymerase sigma-70 factor (ECF subfamily)